MEAEADLAAARPRCTAHGVSFLLRIATAAASSIVALSSLSARNSLARVSPIPGLRCPVVGDEGKENDAGDLLHV